MTLFWKKPETPKPGFDYKGWYRANKKRLSDKKAKRYREDSQYRDAALQRSRNQRLK
jgi:hypothetical protein